MAFSLPIHFHFYPLTLTVFSAHSPPSITYSPTSSITLCFHFLGHSQRGIPGEKDWLHDIRMSVSSFIFLDFTV